MKNLPLIVYFILVVFSRFSGADCSSNQIESWIQSHTKTTSLPFKVYHWGTRVGFKEKFDLDLQRKVHSSWEELFYFRPTKFSEPLSEEENIKILLSTSENQGLEYFKSMSNNYFWKNVVDHPSDKIDQDWSIGMGFYAALDPIQSIPWADTEDWILMELDVPKNVNYLFVENSISSDKGPCGIGFDKVNQKKSEIDENSEKIYLKFLEKYKIYFIAFDWVFESKAKKIGCKESNQTINAFNFISSSLASVEGFKWKFFSRYHLNDQQTEKDFDDLSRRLSFYSTFYKIDYDSKFNNIFEHVSGIPFADFNVKISRKNKKMYLNDIYSCNGVD